MNLIWHIVKKDLRRFRLPIALMAGVLILKTVLLYSTPDPARPVAINGLEALSLIADLLKDKSVLLGQLLSFLCFMDFLFLVGLVPAILCEDPTLGDKTYWRTLPVAGWQMLAAKALTIFLIAWPLQAVLQIAVNLHYANLGSSASHAANLHHWYESLGSMTTYQACFVSLFIIIPLLWKSFVVGAGVLFLVYVFLEFLTVFTGTFLNVARDGHASGPSFNLGYVLLGIWLLSVAATGVTMYCWRRRVAGFLILAASVTTIYVTSVCFGF
jgi:hypothetical protein